jgi:hypothetical protein
VNRRKRKALVRDARKLAAETFPDTEGKPGCCLFLAWATCVVAERYGLKLLMYAGSAAWPCMDDEHDDGYSPNVFEYVFDPNDHQTIARLSAGMLPEMHVWAGNPRTGDIIDLSTGDLPQQALETAGIEWKAATPPDHWWGPASRLPKYASYKPSPIAGRVAAGLLLKLQEESNGD